MGGVVTGALHLVSPLAAVTAAPAPVAVEAPPAAPTPVAVDWSGRVETFHQLIAADIRRELTDGAARPAPLPDAGDVDDDVLAEHDARVAFLRQRLADGRSRGTLVPARLADLQARLRRAEAARAVAASRLAPGGAPAPALVAVQLSPAARADAARHIGGKRTRVTVAPLATPAPPRPFLTAAPSRLAGAHGIRLHVVHASARPATTLIGVRRAAQLTLRAPHLARHSSGVRMPHGDGKTLRDARRLLAAARLALAAGGHVLPLT